jgi:hypothetical protein
MRTLSTSLGVEQARMMPWSQQQDHVGAVAWWRLCVACAPMLQADSSLASLIGQHRSALVVRNVSPQGRRVMLRGLCAVAVAARTDQAAKAVLEPCVNCAIAAVSSSLAASLEAVTDMSVAVRELASSSPAVAGAALDASWPSLRATLDAATDDFTANGDCSLVAVCRALSTIVSVSCAPRFFRLLCERLAECLVSVFGKRF